MHLIVGLGNPGVRYKLTRHNVGFMVIDALVSHLGATTVSNDFKTHLFKAKFEEHELLLAEPQTFMNLSGEAVQALMAYYKISPEHLLVIHDEVDIPFKSLRLQHARGHGGHNGIRNIHEKIGPEYARLKVGVGRPTIPQMEVADYVLQNFSHEEQAELPDLIGLSADAVLDFVEDGFVKAQNKYNS